LQEIAFHKLDEMEVEPIFQGFRALPDDKQAEIEAESARTSMPWPARAA
jgi:hypothetical protein